MEAISEGAARFFLHPIGYVGAKMGSFLDGITSAFPFWIRPLLLVMIFIWIFLALFPYRIRTPFLSIEPASRPQLPPPPQEAVAGPIVPLHSCDVATDTDDLEDFVRRQEMHAEGEAYREAESVRPRLLQAESSLRRLSSLCLHYISIMSTLTLYYLSKVLREVPRHSPEEEEDIWMEPPDPQVQEPIRRETDSASSQESGFGKGGWEDGVPLDFDETTLGMEDELMEGEVVLPSTEDSLLGPTSSFKGLFPVTNVKCPSPGEPHCSLDLRHRHTNYEPK